MASNADVTASDVASVGASAFVSHFVLGKNGPRVAVKDVVDIAGMPTRAGSRAFENAPPASDNAAIIADLLAAPCTIIGKTALHELAFGVTGLNEFYGAPRNPSYPDLIPGGSSSGSAVAVAAGECDFSIGTDTGGSVRVPAACCGVVGLKPTFGRLSRKGLLPAESTLDCIGPLAADAVGIELAMRCLDASFGVLPDFSGMRIAWLATDCDALVESAVRASARALANDMPVVRAEHFSAAHEAGLTIIAVETYQAFFHLLEGGLVGPEISARLARAEAITPSQLSKAEQVRRAFSAEVDVLLETYDILALPTLPFLPPMVEEAGNLTDMVRITSLCRPFNLSGHPAIAIPAGEVNGRPISLQLVASKLREDRLLAIAREFELRNERKSNG